MKTYNSKSTVRKPMMYGGITKPVRRKVMNVGGVATSVPLAAPMGQGMMGDKMKKAKNVPNMATSVGMMYGGITKKPKS